jgi:hypothetical protein
MKYAELKAIEDKAHAAHRTVTMTVRITAGDPGHPLHGHLGQVTRVFPPMPPGPEIPLRASEARQNGKAGLLDIMDVLEEPFAWPDGRVSVYLGVRGDDEDDQPVEPGGRRWMRPYVLVSPADIELVSKRSRRY